MFRIEIDRDHVWLYQGNILLAKMTISEWSLMIANPKRH